MSPKSNQENPYLPIFTDIAKQLDENNDRQERVYKAARNVVIEAKRVIFLLHREAPNGDRSQILQESESKLNHIVDTMRSQIAQEINSHETLFWRYQGKFSFSIQELIEAMAFHHYLKYGTLIDKDQVEQILNCNAKVEQRIPVTWDDWSLGIADLTGELMRLAINNASDRRTPFRVKNFLQGMMENFNMLAMTSKDYDSKKNQMSSNLLKVENLCYQIVIQAAEFNHISAPLPTTFKMIGQQRQERRQVDNRTK